MLTPLTSKIFPTFSVVFLKAHECKKYRNYAKLTGKHTCKWYGVEWMKRKKRIFCAGQRSWRGILREEGGPRIT